MCGILQVEQRNPTLAPFGSWNNFIGRMNSFKLNNVLLENRIFSLWNVLYGILTFNLKNVNIGLITEKLVVSAEAPYLSDVGWKMSRADLARFMLDCLHDDTDKSKCLAIGVK